MCVHEFYIWSRGRGGWYFLEICFKRTIIRLSKNVKIRFLIFPKKLTFLFETDILHSCSYLGLNIYKLTLLYRNFSNCENVVSFYLTNRLYSPYVNIYTVSQTKHLAFFLLKSKTFINSILIRDPMNNEKLSIFLWRLKKSFIYIFRRPKK